MEYIKIEYQDIHACAEVAFFATATGVSEAHVMLHVTSLCELFENQLARLNTAVKRIQAEEALAGHAIVYKRYFLSDSANQREIIEDEGTVAVSYIQQPPLDGSKVTLWLYMVKGMAINHDDGMTIAEHNGYKHLWRMSMVSNAADPYLQTKELLSNYEMSLAKHGLTLADDCIRTWFFVRDVDSQYAGLVKARREFFTERGLTRDTHYIASTGIGGSAPECNAAVQFEAYSINGLSSEQIQYLYAPTHMNSTSEYGVTFERGTAINYGDRTHIFISGTASINNMGEVVHKGDVKKQTRRMAENVGVLLKEADSSFDDLMQVIVYLRDMGDYHIVKDILSCLLPPVPIVFTLASVCRPTWLVEMECIAVKANKKNNMRDY